MTKVCKAISLFLVLLSLQSCPSKEEPEAEIDTPLYVMNISSDTIDYLRTLRSDGISSIVESDVSLLYSQINLKLSIAPNERREVIKVSRGYISNFDIHYFFVNRDTLLQYTPQTWDRKAGVKYYYMTSYEDYERINFTFEYP
jgi:hypothetical protein